MPRSFAHLLGFSRPAAGKSSADKPDDQRDDESDDEYQDRKKREQDEKESAKASGKKSADKPDDQGEDESDEDYEERKRREQEDAKASDDDDEKDDKDEKAKAARGRERARCAAIFSSSHAATRPDMAAHYAFATNLSRKDALTALAAVCAGQPQASGLGSRMGRFEQMRPGAGGPSSKPAASAGWDAVAKNLGYTPK